MLHNPQSKTDNPKCNTPLSPANIQEGLKTDWLGKGLIHCHETLDSTNNEAKRLARAGAPEGTIVLAECQHKGKGRMERTWVSPQGGGVYLSVVLRPRILPKEIQKLTFVAAVALAFTMKHFGIMSQIKWPNDIVVHGKKVAGILMELASGTECVEFVIIGIGVNVNTSIIDKLPLSIRNSATSLDMVNAQPARRREIIQVLLWQLELWYGRFLGGSFEMVLEVWRQFNNTVGRRVKVILSDATLDGIAEAVDSDGSLLVRDNKGRLHSVIAGDVVHCRPLPQKKS